MSRYAYYVCHQCEQPFFGGERVSPSTAPVPPDHPPNTKLRRSAPRPEPEISTPRSSSVGRASGLGISTAANTAGTSWSLSADSAATSRSGSASVLPIFATSATMHTAHAPRRRRRTCRNAWAATVPSTFSRSSRRPRAHARSRLPTRPQGKSLPSAAEFAAMRRPFEAATTTAWRCRRAAKGRPASPPAAALLTARRGQTRPWHG